jgi:hypothetical protein
MTRDTETSDITLSREELKIIYGVKNCGEKFIEWNFDANECDDLCSKFIL